MLSARRFGDGRSIAVRVALSVASLTRRPTHGVAPFGRQGTALPVESRIVLVRRGDLAEAPRPVLGVGQPGGDQPIQRIIIIVLGDSSSSTESPAWAAERALEPLS